MYWSECTHHEFRLMQHWLFPHSSRRSSAKPLLIHYSCLRWARYIMHIRTGKHFALAWYVRNNLKCFMSQKYYYCSSQPHYAPDRGINKWECVIKTGCSVSSVSWMWVCIDPDHAFGKWNNSFITAVSLQFVSGTWCGGESCLLNKQRCTYIDR